MTLVNGNTIYIPIATSSSYQNPQVGDTQVNYYVLPNEANVTTFGKLDGKNIVSFYDDNNNKLFYMYPGSRADAISSLHSQYVLWLWVFRGIGFIMMWLGLSMLFSPILTLLSILPILASIGGFTVMLATFVIALILTAVTIVVSIIAHNPIALISSVVVAIVILIAFGFHVHNKRGGAQSQDLTSNQ